MNFERQLESIKNKADLHKWIDEIPDDAQGIVMMQLPSEPSPSNPGQNRDVFRFRHFGDIEIRDSVYMARCWEHWLLGISDD